MGILLTKAKAALGDVECRSLSISAMSLDFNPIGNIFNFVWSKLNEDAIAMDITKEDFNSISARVKSTISSDSTDFTDKAIESMNKETYETDNCWKRTRKKILDAS